MTTYTYSGTVKTFTVTQTGTYDITAYGASGGAGYANVPGTSLHQFAGGMGAEIEGTVTLTAGEKLRIVVGGQGGGTTGHHYLYGGGGGGGTFVFANTGANGTYVPLIVAGGGGGGGSGFMGGSGTGKNASYANSPAGSSTGGAIPAYNEGGTGGGGAGVKGAGQRANGHYRPFSGYGGSNGPSYAGGAPGIYAGQGGHGGFGGGGGAGYAGTGGGGGGYSGGDGGIFSTGGGAGGGTSFFAGTPSLAKNADAAGQNGNGEVILVNTDPPAAPSITGTVAGQTTTSEAAIKPFSGVTISDANANATDTLTITLGGSGGTLTGTGLTTGSNGVYTLTGSAATVTSELDALSFTPAAGQPNTTSTTTFSLSDASSAGSSAVDSTTSVIDTDPAVAPTVTVIPSSYTITTLGSFSGGIEGSYPVSRVIEDSAGNLFGTTTSGGASGNGTVFEIAAGSNTVTTLASFDSSTGLTSDLVEDSSGNLYGTTFYGGASNQGTLFEVAAGSGEVTTLVSFGSNIGSNPNDGLVEDSAGNLFGTTGSNGPNGFGTVFEIAAGTGAFTTVANLTRSQGLVPVGDLIEDSAGNLYGTAVGGGAYNDGTVFEVLAGTGTVDVLGNFDGSNGQHPNSGVIEDSAGNLFGVTQTGGANNDGTVFEIAAGSGTITTLASFNGTSPYGGLIEDSAGNLYGTTVSGGAHNAGTVFEIVAGSGTIETLFSFAISNGGNPQAALIADANGNFFGTTNEGGPGGQGTVFELAPTPITTTSAAPVSPFTNATISDANANATDTLTITLGGSGGTLSGTGLTANPDGTYTLSGNAATVTSELQGLSFTPIAGGPNSQSTTTFTLSDKSSAFATPTIVEKTSVVDIEPAVTPTISGTVAAQATSSEAAVSPFSGVTIGDTNANATDTLTIRVGGSGGTLSGTGLTGGMNGVYTLTGDAASVTSELQGLSFTPTAGQPNAQSTTTFTLSDKSSAFATPVVDGTTSVVDSDPAVASTISGTVAAQATTSEASISPFTKVVIGDANANATDTLTIALGGTGGTLSGIGLTANPDGTYTLTGDAATVTSELQALSFTPAAGQPNTSSTTTFTLSDKSSVFAAPTVDTTTSVVDIDPAVTPTISGTVAAQATTSEAAVSPFSGITIGDANANATDTLTISLGGAGGTLSGTGLTANADGTYTLSGDAAIVTSELQGVSFTPTAGQPNTSSTTTFTLSDISSALATPVVDGTISVIDTDPPVAPTISAAPPTYTLSTLASFNGVNGSTPDAGLIADSAGNLYGTTQNGGAAGQGTVFEIAAGTSTVTTLATFSGSNGANPYAGLIMDSAGNLYGTTAHGGASGYGTVFEIAAGTDTLTPLASFDYDNGESPFGDLTADSAGNLYGATDSGGQFGDGTVFEIVKGSGTITALASLSHSSKAGLIFDSAGNLYGTTEFGGPSNDGTVFEVAAGSGTVTTLANFDGNNGTLPVGDLVADSAGNLYGTTAGGGANNDGTVFEIAKGSNTITTIANFTGSNGAYPNSSLILDSAGNLYGTTAGDDISNDGTVFEIVKGSNTITTLTSFIGSNGSSPVSNLIADGSGNFYGTTALGGAANDGTVFKLTPVYAPVQTTSSAPVSPFAGVTIGDANADATETLTITLSGGGGTLSGTGLTVNMDGTYTLTGNAATVTSELQALSFTPTAGQPNTTSTTTFSLSDKSSVFATATVDSTTRVVDTDPAVAPTISGTVAAQATTSEASLKPFTGVTVGDTNANATETLTITLGGAGGTLSGTRLTGGTNGVYTLTGSAATVTSELDALSFTPTAGQVNNPSTTTFTLSDKSSAFATSTVDSTTSVIDSDPSGAAPTLVLASDTGASSTDGVTKDNTPTFTGTVTAGAKVTLSADGKVVGTATAKSDGTYSITSSKLAEGTHALSVTTTVGSVTSPSSATTTITVDTVAPTKLGAPTLATSSNAGVTNDATLTFTGTAEAGTEVVLMNGKTQIGEGTASSNGTYSITTATLKDGTYKVTATATDLAGNTSTASPATTIVVDTVAPVTPAAPALAKGSDTGRSTTDGITDAATVTLTGKVEAGSTVTLYNGSTIVTSVTASSTGAYSIALPNLIEESYTFSVTATDKAGNASSHSPSITVDVDRTAPATPGAPALAVDTGASSSDGLTDQSKPAITGTAEAGATVTLYDGTKVVGTATADGDGDYSVSPTAALKDGAHSLSVTATDAAGNVSSHSTALAITTDTKAPAKPAAPTLAVSSDTGSSSKDGITSDTTPTLTGKAEAGSTVTLYADGTTDVVGTTTADSTGAYSITASELTDGVHKLTVTAADAAGNISSPSAAKTVTIETEATPTITTGAGTVSTASQTIKGTGTAGAKIAIVDNDSATLGTATVAANGTWSIKVKFTAASNSLVAQETDLAGNVGTSSAVVLDVPSLRPAQTFAVSAGANADLTRALFEGFFGTGSVDTLSAPPHATSPHTPSLTASELFTIHHA